MKRTTSILAFMVVAALLFASCTKEGDFGNVQIGIKAVETDLKSGRADLVGLADAGSINAGSLVLDKFLINIKEIEFEFYKPYPGFVGPHNCECESDGECQIEFDGPFLIDIASSQALTGVLLGSFELPSALYDEIELDISPSRNDSNELIAGRSVYIAGTIDGQPFEMWTNKKAELEIEFPGRKGVDITKDDASRWIRISLSRIRSNLAAMDLSSAVDGNGNGIIEIGHNDQDGNNALSATLFNAFRGSFDIDD